MRKEDKGGLPGFEAGVQRAKVGHTPGPWVADVEYQHGPIVEGGDGSIVADYTMWDGDMLEAKANARLIAAVLALLAVAQLLVKTAREQDLKLGPLVGDAIEAIAKATGADQ